MSHYVLLSRLRAAVWWNWSSSVELKLSESELQAFHPLHKHSQDDWGSAEFVSIATSLLQMQKTWHFPVLINDQISLSIVQTLHVCPKLNKDKQLQINYNQLPLEEFEPRRKPCREHPKQKLLQKPGFPLFKPVFNQPQLCHNPARAATWAATARAAITPHTSAEAVG